MDLLLQEIERLKMENNELQSQLHFLLNPYEREDTCQPHYSVIENIGIGDMNSSYTTFSIVVDVSSSIKKNTVTSHFGKKVYRVFIKNLIQSLEEIILVLPENERILFHCDTGLIYSALFAIVYLVKIKSWSLEIAIEKIKWLRPIRIEPFMEELKKFS